MSGRKAKALRKAVYGDLSLKAPQSVRAAYQQAKRGRLNDT